MPRYNVKHDGKWACFSSICDAFITEFMDKKSYEEWQKLEYGLADYEPAEKRNMMDMQEAVWHIRLNRNKDDAMKCLLKTGLSKAKCMRLMYDMESKYYIPILQEDGTYICPNCKEVIEKGQEYCKQYGCEHELVWRN